MPFKIELTAKLPQHINSAKALLQYKNRAIVSGFHERVKPPTFRIPHYALCHSKADIIYNII